MKKVLFICTDWYGVGGSTESLVNLISSTRYGVSPIVLLHKKGVVEEYLQSLGIETIIAPFFYLWDKPKQLLTAIHHPTRTALYRSLTMNRNCCKTVLQQLNGRKIDIVHSNTTVTDLGVMLSRMLGAKHLWHVRESLFMLGIHPYGGERRLKRKLNSADARIIISNALADQWMLSSDGTYVVHDAVFNKMPVKNNLRKEKIVLFCAAQINDFKGSPIAVEAFCKAELDGYKLVFVGNCTVEYRNHLLSIADMYGKRECLEFVGFQTNLKSFFSSSAAFLMCSRFEGLGRVTIEAMAYCCPVVAKADGGTTDFVKQGETGYLFNSIDECAEALRIAVQYDNNLVDAAYDMVRNEFTEDQYGERIIQIYNEIL